MHIACLSSRRLAKKKKKRNIWGLRAEIQRKSREFSSSAAHLSTVALARTDELNDPWPLGLKPFPVRTCKVFSRSRAFWFVLSECLQTIHVVSHHFSCHVWASERMCRYPRLQPPLRIWVVLTVLFQTLKEQDFVQVRWRRKEMKSYYSYRSSCKTPLGSKIASKRLLRQRPPRRLRLQILNKWLGALWLASLFRKRNAASGASRPDLARSWNFLRHSVGSTITGSLASHGPGSSYCSRNTRCRLETFSSPEDEQARNAVFLWFPCEQNHQGITKWINTLPPET